MESKIFLYPDQFSEKERAVLSFGCLRASLFRYDSGVCAIREMCIRDRDPSEP